ncbi:MAG: hypothetical protein H7141_07110 [Burkholderiales bacterium]|nr:hypothetical protein [Bacteroidia bacterium]
MKATYLPKIELSIETKAFCVFMLKAIIQMNLVFIQLNLMYHAEMYEMNEAVNLDDGFLKQLELITSGIYSYVYLYPFYYFFKVVFIALILATGLQSIKRELSFYTLIFFVCICELILVVPDIAKLFWFTYLNNGDYLRIHIRFYSFGTLANFFDSEQLTPWLWQFLQSFSIWDLSYLLLLAYLICSYYKLKFDLSFKIVCYTYGVSYFIFTLLTCLFLFNLR